MPLCYHMNIFLDQYLIIRMEFKNTNHQKEKEEVVHKLDQVTENKEVKTEQEQDSLIVHISYSTLHPSEVLRARMMGDGDFRDALEIIALSDEDYFLVKMKEEQVSLCKRKKAKENLPQGRGQNKIKKVVILLQPLSVYLPTPIVVMKATFLFFFDTLK